MEPALKQRVVGAAVLVALAVIFLPMLIKGPAPESGISDVPLTLPPAPQGESLDEEVETRELPLVAPGAAPASGAVGMNSGETPPEEAADLLASAGPDNPVSNTGMMPAAVAGGDYAVSFGRYATAADAQRVVAALLASQLPGYQESTTDNGRVLHRVRIGPYATQADAEAARLRAAHVRDDVGARVVVLDADAATSGAGAPSEPQAPTASMSNPGARIDPQAVASRPAESKPAESKQTASQPRPTQSESKPAAAKPVAAKPAPAKPVATTAAPAQAATVKPAAANTGFAVQLGAFGNAGEAAKLRDRARAAGFRAFVEAVPTDKGVLSRVRVGPVLTRGEADQLKAQVVAKLGIGDAIVKPHP